MVIGTIVVISLSLLANLPYLFTLPLDMIQHAPSDRVGTATVQAVFPGLGTALMAGAIMVSTFATINALILTGPRAYYAMARQGLFFHFAGRLNRASVPAWVRSYLPACRFTGWCAGWGLPTFLCRRGHRQIATNKDVVCCPHFKLRISSLVHQRSPF